MHRETIMQDSKRQANLLHWGVTYALGLAMGLLWPSVRDFLEQPVMTPPNPYVGQCTRIVDGDTVIIATRLTG